jgi:hypothetical protein
MWRVAVRPSYIDDAGFLKVKNAILWGVCVGAVGRGNALQPEGLRVQFPRVSL